MPWVVLFQSLQGGFVDSKLLRQFPPGQYVEHPVTPDLLAGRLGLEEAFRHVSQELDDFRELTHVRQVMAEFPPVDGHFVHLEPGPDLALEELQIEPSLSYMVTKGQKSLWVCFRCRLFGP